MKTNYTLKIFGLITVFMFLQIPFLTAQARYKHIPRIKLDMEKKEKTNSIVEIPATPKLVIIGEKNPYIIKELNDTTKIPVVTLTLNHVVQSSKKINSSVNYPQIIDHKRKTERDTFTRHQKEQRKLADVKKQQKSAQTMNVLWFIITLALAFILIVLAIILIVAFSYLFYWIFLTFGIVALVIAVILLVLLLS